MSAKKLTLLVFIISMSYVILRYHFFGDIPLSDIPAFLLNKALAYSGLLLLGFAGLQSRSSKRHKVGMAAAYFLLIHVIMTITLFSPEYFSKFFIEDSKRLTLFASLSLLCGTLAFVCLTHLWRVSINTRKGTDLSLVNGLGRLLLILVAGHTGLMGFKGWFSPETWPGRLPPLTLIAFVTASIFLWITHKRKHSNV
ncbi:MAG: hypothetical protein CMJ76_14690 [Planctomycetaceae bacterium]|nr:hypothetical protein [Planctomycetaceae bacterium]|tara:strand:+ start:2109 stop:2699 length:591 start_codon:yes stop_codon:yes gene_type:complete